MAETDTSPPLFKDRTDQLLALGLLVVAALVRLWPLLSIHTFWEDTYFYVELARAIPDKGYALLDQPHTKYLPGYPLLILVVHTVFFGILDWLQSARVGACGAAQEGPHTVRH